MATTRETFVIEYRADGSQAIIRTFEQIGRSAQNAVDGLYLLKRALRTVGVFYLANELKQLADAYTQIQNKLGLVTKDTTDYRL